MRMSWKIIDFRRRIPRVSYIVDFLSDPQGYRISKVNGDPLWHIPDGLF